MLGLSEFKGGMFMPSMEQILQNKLEVIEPGVILSYWGWGHNDIERQTK